MDVTHHYDDKMELYQRHFDLVDATSSYIDKEIILYGRFGYTNGHIVSCFVFVVVTCARNMHCFIWMSISPKTPSVAMGL